jgi:hypothetical protein
MAQAFDCLCGKPTCCGRISGAGDMTDAQLRDKRLNKHIQELLVERKTATISSSPSTFMPIFAAEDKEIKVQGNGRTSSDGSNEVSENDTVATSFGGASPTVESTSTTPTSALGTGTEQSLGPIPDLDLDLDQTAIALRQALEYAEKAVGAARHALASYLDSIQRPSSGVNGSSSKKVNGVVHAENNFLVNGGAQRRGPTSRELSGEMGGDTTTLAVAV